MKSNITIKSTKGGRLGAVAPIITGFQLSGKTISGEEEELWISTLAVRRQKNFELFKGHLVDHTRK